MTDRSVRPARPADRAAVADFTAGTWPERDVEDYIPRVFEEWVSSTAADSRLVVATVDDRPVGVCQGRLLTDEEAWLQGIRVAPAHRGEGHGRAMTRDLLDWAAGRGATVARVLVFGWNEAGLVQAHTTGFEAVTAGRWARRSADPSVAPALAIRDAVPPAWAHWTDSPARDWLGGLALADEHAWAVAELTRVRLEGLATRERVVTVREETTRAMTVRAGTRERTADGATRHIADYAVAAWADGPAAVSLFDAVAADAAAVGVDRARVLIPETPRTVAEAAVAGASLSDEPFYVLAADLSDRGTSGD